MKSMQVVWQSQELICQIQLHIKPRHLFKLLQTCKGVRSVLDGHKRYWERVAAHLVWRTEIYEFCYVPYRWEDMVNLPEGYNRAMNLYMGRIDGYMREDDLYKDYLGFAEPVRGKLSADKDGCYKGDCVSGGRYTCMEIFHLSMKGIAKREVESIRAAHKKEDGLQAEMEASLRQWANMLDDMDIPIDKKGLLTRALNKCLSRWGTETLFDREYIQVPALCRTLELFDDKQRIIK